VNSSEIEFLALGLILGGALGAAFLTAVRTGLAPRREVRVTISPNSIDARRSVTLQDLALLRDRRPPPGSPDEAAWPEGPVAMHPIVAAAASHIAVATSPMRPYVLIEPVLDPATAVAVGTDTGRGIAVGGGLPADPLRSRGPATTTAAPSAGSSVSAGSSAAVAVKSAPVTAPETRAMTAILDVGASPERLVRPRDPVEPARPVLVDTAVGIAIASAGEPEGSVPDPSPAGATSGARPEASAGPSVDPCADPRAVVGERCAAADVARERSRVAANIARDAQRELDALREQVARARELSDPRVVEAAKATLREQFRAEDAAAATPDDSEAAARRWLHGINLANNDVRSAVRLAESGTAEMPERLAAVERLAQDADAARISAECADEKCRIAREELARCEEHVAATAPAAAPEGPHPFAGVWPTQQDMTLFRSPQDAPADALAGSSAILRVVLGDRAALDRVVAAVAGSDPAAVANWQIRITALSDAIVARAIEAGYLILPEDDAFWGLFSDRERREIVEALASLGFRFDGLGGFAGDRAPAARDLSLAVGYAGLDRMRIRTWPQGGDLAGLYSRATVAADEWLTWVARDLELGPLTAALGPRAAGLGAIWDAWGRIRPALLATD
jgi:hypothetical protein